MNMIDMILTYWPMLTGLIVTVAWFVRIEAKGMSNARDLKQLWNTRNEDRERFNDHTKATNHKLDRLSDKMDRGL